MLANVGENKTKQAVETSKCAWQSQAAHVSGSRYFSMNCCLEQFFQRDVIFVFISKENEF